MPFITEGEHSLTRTKRNRMLKFIPSFAVLTVQALNLDAADTTMPQSTSASTLTQTSVDLLQCDHCEFGKSLSA
jgi:hypothetical protein